MSWAQVRDDAGPGSMDGHGKIDSDAEQGSSAPIEHALSPYLTIQKAAACLRSFYGDPVNRAQLLEEIGRVVAAHKITLLSIDVFDTALLRSPGSELGRFWSLSKRFHETLPASANGPDPSAEDAMLVRIAAMRAAYGMQRHSVIGSDPSLDDIAGTVCSLLNRPDLTEHYVRTELECEIEDVTLNPLISEIREHFPSLRTVFLSDMYLDSRRIGRILTTKSDISYRPKVYSSADGHGSKIGGGLFDHVAKTLRVKPNHALHIGDHLEHDYRGAKRRGWHALHLPLPDEELRERRARFAGTRAEIIALDGGFGHECRFAP
ncbi:HAD hydrolase-like protein [Nisaea denitrificans]|uniref:HAD hydrolase-like protein n=1 Tax=Nisaea denitrificans TaxID=390877 RepID=UPI0012EC0125|nr:HAD hydrolase-like protein [Nisaea denitrificans]